MSIGNGLQIDVFEMQVLVLIVQMTAVRKLTLLHRRCLLRILGLVGQHLGRRIGARVAQRFSRNSRLSGGLWLATFSAGRWFGIRQLVRSQIKTTFDATGRHSERGQYCRQ